MVKVWAYFISLVLIVLLLAFVIFWGITKYTSVPENIAPAAAQSLSASTTVIKRAPDSLPSTVTIPKGYKEVRRGHLKVTAKPTKDSPKECKCEPVPIDFALAKDDKGGGRLIVDTGKNTLLEGVDSPVKAQDYQKETSRWRGWVGYSTKKEVSVGIAKDYGPFMLGAEVEKRKTDSMPTAKIIVGITW